MSAETKDERILVVHLRVYRGMLVRAFTWKQGTEAVRMADKYMEENKQKFTKPIVYFGDLDGLVKECDWAATWTRVHQHNPTAYICDERFDAFLSFLPNHIEYMNPVFGTAYTITSPDFVVPPKRYSDATHIFLASDYD